MKICSESKLQNLLKKQKNIQNTKLSGHVIIYTQKIQGFNKFLMLIWHTIKGIFTCSLKPLFLTIKGKKVVALDCKKIEIYKIQELFNRFLLICDFEILSKKWDQIKKECQNLGRGSPEVQKKLSRIKLGFDTLLERDDPKSIKIIRILLDISKCYHIKYSYEKVGYEISLMRKGANLQDPQLMYTYAGNIYRDKTITEIQRKKTRFHLYQQLKTYIEKSKGEGVFGNYERYIIYEGFSRNCQLKDWNRYLQLAKSYSTTYANEVEQEVAKIKERNLPQGSKLLKELLKPIKNNLYQLSFNDLRTLLIEKEVLQLYHTQETLNSRPDIMKYADARIDEARKLADK